MQRRPCGSTRDISARQSWRAGQDVKSCASGGSDSRVRIRDSQAAHDAVACAQQRSIQDGPVAKAT